MPILSVVCIVTREFRLYSAGLDAGSLELTKKYDEIVYISCNPAKLRAELDSFPDHKIEAAALFDQVCVPAHTRNA